MTSLREDGERLPLGQPLVELLVRGQDAAEEHPPGAEPEPRGEPLRLARGDPGDDRALGSAPEVARLRPGDDGAAVARLATALQVRCVERLLVAAHGRRFNALGALRTASAGDASTGHGAEARQRDRGQAGRLPDEAARSGRDGRDRPQQSLNSRRRDSGRRSRRPRGGGSVRGVAGPSGGLRVVATDSRHPARRPSTSRASPLGIAVGSFRRSRDT